MSENQEPEQDLEYTELKPAYSWICDNCGRTQYLAEVVIEVPSRCVDIQLQAELGITDRQLESMIEKNYGVKVAMVAKVVKCQDCSSEFTALPYNHQDEWEDADDDLDEDPDFDFDDDDDEDDDEDDDLWFDDEDDDEDDEDDYWP